MSVLYDAPGPRGRRRIAIASVIAAALIIVGGYLCVYRPLEARGQFSATLWGPLLNPGDENFRQVWLRLWTGFQATLLAAVCAIAASLAVGTALAILRVHLRSLGLRRFPSVAPRVSASLRASIRVLTWSTRLCLEVFRGIPVVITIFFVWASLPAFGVTFEQSRWYLVIGLAIYNSVVICEILRSGMEGLPSGQREAAQAIGLTQAQTTWLVLLPQAFRIMLPALISQLVVVLKDTSLGFIIGYEESLRIGSQIMLVLDNPIQVFMVIGVIFVAVNSCLSWIASRVRVNGRSR